MQHNEFVDIAAETGIIMSAIAHPDFLEHSTFLTDGMFVLKEHSALYWAITDLYFKDRIYNLDETNIQSKLNSNKKCLKALQSIGWYDQESESADITEFMSLAAPTIRTTVDEYQLLVHRVLSLAYHRKTLSQLELSISHIKNGPEEDMAVTHNYIMSGLDQIMDSYILSKDTIRFSDKIDDLWSEIEKARENNGRTGYSWPWESLNKYCTIDNGELYLFNGRMKHGKSSVMLNIFTHLLKQKIPVCYFDTEMSDSLFYRRILANLTGIPIQQILSGSINYDQSQRLAKANNWLKKQQYDHIYEPQFTNEKIITHARKAQRDLGMRVLIYDYIKDDSTSDSSKIYNLLGQKTNLLKNDIAGNLNIPVISGVQLNRNNMVADSDKIERYATFSSYWSRKTPEEIATDGEDCGNCKLYIPVNRSGSGMVQDDYIDFMFYHSKMRIKEAKQHAELNLM